MRSSDWSSDVCSSDLEAGTRLMKQLGQLARIMAWIDGKDRVDEETMHQVKRVAMDTAYGFHLEIVDAMMRMGGVGRSEERSVGQECVSAGRSRWAGDSRKKENNGTEDKG